MKAGTSPYGVRLGYHQRRRVAATDPFLADPGMSCVRDRSGRRASGARSKSCVRPGRARRTGRRSLAIRAGADRWGSRWGLIIVVRTGNIGRTSADHVPGRPAWAAQPLLGGGPAGHANDAEDQDAGEGLVAVLGVGLRESGG